MIINLNTMRKILTFTFMMLLGAAIMDPGKIVARGSPEGLKINNVGTEHVQKIQVTYSSIYPGGDIQIGELYETCYETFKQFAVVPIVHYLLNYNYILDMEIYVPPGNQNNSSLVANNYLLEDVSQTTYVNFFY